MFSYLILTLLRIQNVFRPFDTGGRAVTKHTKKKKQSNQTQAETEKSE